MNYFFLDCFTSGGNTLRSVDNTDPFAGITNRMLRKGTLLDVPEDVIAQFYFDKIPQGIIPEMFNLPTFIITPELFSALKACGVDNIQAWPARITDKETRENYDFVLCNILSVVEIIDNSASSLSPDSPVHTAALYKQIVFEKDKSNTPHLFRPLNKRTSIVVSEQVRNYLESLGTFSYISFHRPDHYA